MTIKTYINLREEMCIENNKPSHVVKYLLLETSGLSNANFYLSMNDEIGDELKTKCDYFLNQYIRKNIPIDYILGYRYFYGYKFKVNKDVLIPRVETEELVERVLILIDRFNLLNVLDLGTGSGAIGISIKKENPKCNVILSDISDEALEVAKQNSQLLHTKLEIKKSSWLENINEKFDIIICNPPYIPLQEKLNPRVKKEPRIALFGGSSGLDHYNTILMSVKKNLKENSIIAFEHAYNQSAEITNLIKKYLPNFEVKTVKDYQNRERFTFASSFKI